MIVMLFEANLQVEKKRRGKLSDHNHMRLAERATLDILASTGVYRNVSRKQLRSWLFAMNQAKEDSKGDGWGVNQAFERMVWLTMMDCAGSMGASRSVSRTAARSMLKRVGCARHATR